MKKRIAWLLVSGLMVLSLVVASCAPKVTEEKEAVTEKKEVVTEKEVAAEKEVVTEKEGVEMAVDALGRLVEKPQYGGVLRVASWEANLDFSRSVLNRTAPRADLKLTNDPLLLPDRLKGPHGTGQYLGRSYTHDIVEVETGHVAESWEIIEPDTLKFKIRQGIHWQDRAPTYGAEVTPEDVVYTFLARWGRAGSVWKTSYFYVSDINHPENSIYIDPDDPRVVVFKSPLGQLGMLWERIVNYDIIVPKALGPIEGEGFGDWRGVVGSGPFLLTDYVMGSSLTWKRNPNYWARDAFHPQNQLPYLDGVQYFIIPDLSTQQAALRTGKLELLTREIDAETLESLLKTNPELQRAERFIVQANGLAMRQDKPPFNDVRVRRAMMMAIDHDEIVNDYYKGEAVKFFWPPRPIPEHAGMYLPLEEMPRSVQELYEYHPDKAKELLKEAGYPDGFITSVTLDADREKTIDMAAVVAAYWAKVGVTLKLDVRESAVIRALTGPGGALPDGKWASLSDPSPYSWHDVRVGHIGNAATKINDPVVEATWAAIQKNYFNYAEVARIMREALPIVQERALIIILPLPKEHSIWQPWLKGYHGEIQGAGYGPTGAYEVVVGSYVWIDQALKKSMGH